MNDFQKLIGNLHPYLLSSVASIFTVAQIVLTFLLPGGGSLWLEWAGWICVWSGGIFGVLPVLIFRQKGGVEKGKSYIHTSQLVDTGLYAVVRHPQNGTAWLLICLGLGLVSQHWPGAVLGGISMLLAYIDTFKADQRCIEKFGDGYRAYIDRVPRVNFLAGIWRLITRR